MLAMPPIQPIDRVETDMSGLEMTPELFAAAARYLAEHPEATALTLDDLGILSEAPALQTLGSPIDASRLDLVEEFRSRPGAPTARSCVCSSGTCGHSTLRALCARIRGRESLARAAPGRWDAA